jgi:hypothetical protein
MTASRIWPKPHATDAPPALHPCLALGLRAFDLIERVAVPAAWRDTLLGAIIPGATAPPGRVLPSLQETDLAAFWPRFRAAAPIHVRLALAGATLALGGLLPVATTGRPLSRLSAEARERVIGRAAALPVARDLLEIAKVIACLAYFEDPSVQARVRGHA